MKWFEKLGTHSNFQNSRSTKINSHKKLGILLQAISDGKISIWWSYLISPNLKK